MKIKKNNKFFAIDDNGDGVEAIIIKENHIQIKSKYLKEFLAVKNMYLAIFFEINRYSTKTLEEQGMKEYNDSKTESNYCYSISVHNWNYSDTVKSHGRLFGKKLIQGLQNFKPKLFDKENRMYEEFIINIDDDGNEVIYTCNENKLANFFGKNEGSPFYLTPVFFKSDVLGKYYSQPTMYSVGDGYLMYARLWRLRMDNNHPDHVMVFLGDLGILPHKEQLYWKHYNIVKKGKMSYTAWARGFEAKFADPEKSDLFFKQRFATFSVKWKEKFGWELFVSLSKDDAYLFKTLRIPITNEQQEFDALVLSLAKIIIDSLNEKELVKGLTLDNPN